MCSSLLLSTLLMALASPLANLPGDIHAPAHRDGPVTARLLPADGSWRPGATQLVGVQLSIQPGWHLYWDGANNSGLPIRVLPSLPPGFQVGDLLWPAPRRLVHPGDLVDHVYEGEVTLLLLVQVPSDLEPGATLEMGAELSWLVCEEACIPGRAELTLRMTVGPAATEPTETGTTETRPLTASESGRRALGSATPPPPIARALERLPGPARPALSVRWQDDAALLRWDGARRLAFYPAAVGLGLLDIAGSCAAEGQSLSLRLDPDPYPPAPEADPELLGRLRGLLEIWNNADDNSYICAVDLPGPPSQPDEKRTSPDHDPEEDP